MKPLGGLALVGGTLGAETVDAGAEGAQLGVVVAKRTGLRGAAAGAGDLVPAGGDVLIRPTGARVEIDDGAAGERGEVGRFAGRGLEGDRGEGQAGEVGGGAVVDGNGEV